VLLPLWNHLVAVRLSDPEMLDLAARHYSWSNLTAKKLGGPARSLLLRNTNGTVLFLWQWPRFGMRRDKENGYNCVMFRNESSRLASDIILEAEECAVRAWGQNRFFTYVDPHKVASINPGYCFKRAGWQFIRKSANGKHLLAKEVT
jgi:hypothetical protein